MLLQSNKGFFVGGDMELKGSKTESNLKTAFAGESEARNKYDFYSSKAKKDGYVEISRIIEEISNNEREHAKIWFKLLHGNSVPSTIENLKDCIKGEQYERTDMYVRFAKEAREEGFDEIADLFEGVAKIEHDHEKNFERMLNEVTSKTVFSKNEEVSWVCLNCGHIHKGNDAPSICPVCAHGKEYFSVRK